MKRIILALSTLVTLSLSAQNVLEKPAISLRPDRTILLYGDPAQAEKDLRGHDLVIAKKIETLSLEMKEDNGITEGEVYKTGGNISKISRYARFDLYFPKNPNGQMIVACPGGGYTNVSSYNEGLYLAEWMLARGITVAVVKYRLPNGHWEVPLTDVQNVFRYCRTHASEWKVNQIGVIGASAGGHLAASVTTLYGEDHDVRPDFSVLIYPVISMDPDITHRGTRENLLGKIRTFRERKTPLEHEVSLAQEAALVQKYTLQNNVGPDTPPCFIVLCSDDMIVPADNSLLFYSQMIRYGRPVEMHIFPTGGHGWGFNDSTKVPQDRIEYCRTEYYQSLDRWLKSLR